MAHLTIPQICQYLLVVNMGSAVQWCDINLLSLMSDVYITPILK